MIFLTASLGARSSIHASSCVVTFMFGVEYIYPYKMYLILMYLV